MLRAELQLALIAKQFPTLWKEVDERRAERSRSWPSWCFFPRDELKAIIDPRLPSNVNHDQRDKQLTWLKMATTLIPWRVCRSVYRFDPDIYQAVVNTSIRGQLPVDLLLKLPEWGVYIETPGRDTYYGVKSDAFVASLNFSSEDNGQPMLNMLSLFGKTEFFTEWLFLKEGFTIEESVNEALERHRIANAGLKLSTPQKELDSKEVTAHVTKLLNLLLYICQTDSEFLDVRSADGSDSVPVNPLPTKTKNGLRYFPPKKVTVWECGFRQGLELRRGLSEHSEYQGGTHKSPVTHIRAGHWHTYNMGKGSRNDPSKGRRVLKWIQTILVNAAKKPKCGNS